MLNTIWRVKSGGPPEGYSSPTVDPSIGTLLNGHPKLVSEMEGRWWKLGLGCDDLRVELEAGGRLALNCLVCHLPFILPRLE